MDSEIKLYYKACYIDSVRFYETKYYDKKLYYILMSVLVDGNIREIYIPYKDKISSIKSMATLYYRGKMPRSIDVCKSLVKLGQKFFVRNLQTGHICRDESGKLIQINELYLYAVGYFDESGDWHFMKGNEPTSQVSQLRNRGILVLDSQLSSIHIPFYSRELSSEELLK